MGTLVTNSTVIEAVIDSKPNRPPKIKPDVVEKELSFSVYPRTKNELDGAVILEILKYKKEILDIDSYFSIRGDLVAINEKDFLVRIRRNWNPSKFFDLEIKGKLPCTDINKFWELECVLAGQYLQLVKGQVIGESPIVENAEPQEPNPEQPKLANQEIVLSPTAELKPKYDTLCTQQTSVELKANEQLITEQINVNTQKVTTVKSEITLKFNALPAGEPAPNKKVKLILADQNENRFIVLLNSKSYKKATEGAATYAKYAGNISGKLGKLTPDGFEVLDAGIKIFEVKSNPVDEAESKTIEE